MLMGLDLPLALKGLGFSVDLVTKSLLNGAKFGILDEALNGFSATHLSANDLKSLNSTSCIMIYVTA